MDQSKLQKLFCYISGYNPETYSGRFSFINPDLRQYYYQPGKDAQLRWINDFTKKHFKENYNGAELLQVMSALDKYLMSSQAEYKVIYESLKTKE